MNRKKVILCFLFLLLGYLSVNAQTTIYQGTVKDLNNANVTSGQLTFTLKPSLDTTISGVARITPLTVTCVITGAGAVKANDGTSNCVVTNNTSLTPSGTSYTICIQPYFVTPGSCFNDYALGVTKDISTIVPTPTTSPAFTFVDLASTQTISGNKTFTGNTVFNGNLSFGTLSSSSIGINSLGTATSGANFNSGNLTLSGSVWNGSSGVPDIWTIKDVVGAGTNGTSTLTFSQSGSSGTSKVSFPALSVSGSSALNTGSFAGSWSKGNASSPYILQLIDGGSLNNQVIGVNIEQEANHASNAGWFDFGQATEIFSPTSDTKTFADLVGAYASFSHFGSGALASGQGGNFEGFNSGSATATLVNGVSATANNGGVAAGNPVQTPTNNGNCLNCRVYDATVKNLSSGTITNGVGYFVNAAINTGGGSITNNYGVLVSDQTAGVNNFGVVTGIGKNVFGDQTTFSSTSIFNGLMGQGTSPSSARGFLLTPSGSTGLSGVTQIGIQSSPLTSSGATTEGSGFWVRADTAAAAYTQTLNTGIRVFAPNIGAGSSITEWDGIRIEAAPTASTKCSLNISGSTSGTYCLNTPAVAGSSTSIVVGNVASTLQKSESAADTNVLTLTPTATPGTYRISFALSLSAANTATLGWTTTWKDSNGTSKSPTNLSLFQNGTAAPALTFTTSTTDSFQGSQIIDVDNSATNIVVKLTFSGTSFTGKASATIERIQ